MEWKIEQPRDYSEWEFLLIDSEHQKKLNQWRHEYYIEVLQMTSCNGTPLILIVRKKK
jgi:hypothetical protein